MGLLDDAIREHLELKRRHGADAGELARLEREAFGPARLGADAVAAGAVAEADEPREPADPALIEPEVDPPLSEDATRVHRAPEPPPDPEPSDEDWDEPPAPPPTAAAEPAPPVPGDEDVLEDTPDFLSETPEHDRLWFEQRPPRDFDFDG